MKIQLTKPDFTPIELRMTLVTKAEVQVLYELGNHSSIIIHELMERCSSDANIDRDVAEDILTEFFAVLEGQCD